MQHSTGTVSSWLEANANGILFGVYLLSATFGVIRAIALYSSTELAQESKAIRLSWALLVGGLQAILFMASLGIAIAIPRVLFSILEEPERWRASFGFSLPKLESNDWRRYYEYATYLATIAGLIQLGGYIRYIFKRGQKSDA